MTRSLRVALLFGLAWAWAGGWVADDSAVAGPAPIKTFTQALKDGDADSTDFDRLALMAGLSLKEGRTDTLRRSVANLLRHHPDRPQTHYYRAIQAAMDGEWIAAEDAMLQAGNRGAPPEVVDRFLAAGVHSRAQPRRYGWYVLYAVGGWAAGLVVLLAAGRVLSSLTIRSLRVDDPNLAMTPAQKIIRGAYRVVIDLAGFYYYISLPMVALVAIVVALGLGYATLSLPRIPVKLVLLVALFGFAMLAMIGSIVRSCFARIKPPEPERTLSAEEAPELWELTREVAEQVGTRPIDEIWLTDGTDMAVFERGTRRDKARNRSSRVLILGLDVVEGFRLDGFRAVLAHEYGHFLHRDTAGGDVAMRVQAAMGQFARAMARQGSVQWWNLGWQFLRVYSFLFRRITHGASRLQEVHADRIASLAYGKEAFANGLRHVIRRSIESNHGRSLAVHQATALASGLPQPAGPDHALEASTRRQVLAELARRWQTNTTEDDTHPSPSERVRLLDRLDTPPGEAPDGWLVDVFADPDALLAEHRARLDAQVGEYVTGFLDYHAGLAAQLDAYIAEHPTLGGAYFERANVLLMKGDIGRAVRDYDDAIRLDAPKLALCYNNRGVARGRLGDVEGAEADLAEGARRDPSLARDAWAELGDLHARLGRFDRSIEAYDTALAIAPEDLDLLLKRAEALLERESFAEAEDAYGRVLAKDPVCVDALVGRARAALGLDEVDRARVDLEAATELDPGHPEANLELAAIDGEDDSSFP